MHVYCAGIVPVPEIFFFFFFNDTATTEIYTLSLHDALPISLRSLHNNYLTLPVLFIMVSGHYPATYGHRSEEHTSELQSRLHLVCRLLLEKKNTTIRQEIVDARPDGRDLYRYEAPHA